MTNIELTQQSRYEVFENGNQSAILEFDDYVPDDFVYAPAPDMYFEYYVKDPFGGDYVVDTFTGLYVERFMAYSVEYEGEYYWTYNVYEDYLPDDIIYSLWWWYAPWLPELYAGHWMPAMDSIAFPQTYYSNLYNVGISEVATDVETGDLDVELYTEPNMPTVAMYDYDMDTGDYKVAKIPPIYVPGETHYSIYLEGDYLDDARLDHSGIFYDADLDLHTYELDFSYKPEWQSRSYTSIKIPKENIDGNVELELNVKYIKNKMFESATTFYDDNHNYVHLKPDDKTYRCNLPIGDNVTYKLSFDSEGRVPIVNVPYVWDELGNTIDETFTFTKLFTNEFEYPDQPITELLRIEYTDNASDRIIEGILDSNATIRISGKEYEIPIKQRYDDGDIIIYTDQHMYYDYENEQVKIGESTKYEVQEGIILPWDKSVNGTIEFHIELNTFRNLDFYFEMPFGNEKVLRGDDGKYQIMEVK